MAELDFNSLSPEEKQRLLRELMLNQAQGNLLQTYSPNMDNYEFKKPDNFGQAMGNMFKNQVLNPVQEILGYREPLSSVVKKYQIEGYKADQNQRVIEELNRQQLIDTLSQAGVKTEKLKGLDYEGLQNIYTNLQSTPITGPYGERYTVNALTGEVKPITEPSADMQQYFIDNPNARPGLTAEQRVITETPTPSFSRYQLANEKTKAQSQADIDRVTARQNKLDERALTAIDNLSKPFHESASDAARTLPMLQSMQTMLQNGLQTGFGQGFLTDLRNAGISLNLDVANPGDAEVFRAFANQITIPLVKQLGVNPTDRDLLTIQESLPQLRNSKEGNMVLLQAQIVAAKRAQMMSQLINKFMDENYDLYSTKPKMFEIRLRDAMDKLRASPEYIGKDILQIKANAASILNRGSGIDDVVDALSTNR